MKSRVKSKHSLRLQILHLEKSLPIFTFVLLRLSVSAYFDNSSNFSLFFHDPTPAKHSLAEPATVATPPNSRYWLSWKVIDRYERTTLNDLMVRGILSVYTLGENHPWMAYY